MLPRAEIAFLDEVFKANSAILNALLTILNERTFYNGSRRDTVPLMCAIGATNTVPDDIELAALYDRFSCASGPITSRRPAFLSCSSAAGSWNAAALPKAMASSWRVSSRPMSCETCTPRSREVDLGEIAQPYREVVRRIARRGHPTQRSAGGQAAEDRRRVGPASPARGGQSRRLLGAAPRLERS